MILDLPAAYVGIRQVSARAARNDDTRVAGVLSALVEGRAKVALEREWRSTVALALKQLPPEGCLLVRYSDGTEQYVGPAATARAVGFRKAA